MPDWFYATGDTRSGPHSDDEMRALAQAGRLQADALCWNPEYGESWRPIDRTPFVATRAAQPARWTGEFTPGPITNAYVWIYALLPVIIAVATELLDRAGIDDGDFAYWPTVVSAVTYGVLAKLDADQINLSYARPGQPELSLWWFGLAPVYLWRRATYIRQSRRHFWVWCAVFVISAIILAPTTIRWLTGGLPECRSSYAQRQVLRVADTLDALKVAGKSPVSLTQQSQTGLTDTLRSCQGRLRLADGTEHPTDYSFEKRPNDIFVRIEVH